MLMLLERLRTDRVIRLIML